MNKEEKVFVEMKTQPFELMFALQEQRVKDIKNHYKFKSEMFKLEIRYNEEHAQAISDARFKIHHAKNLPKRIISIVKILLLIAIIVFIIYSCLPS